jgi:hypothetical protein
MALRSGVIKICVFLLCIVLMGVNGYAMTKDVSLEGTLGLQGSAVMTQTLTVGAISTTGNVTAGSFKGGTFSGDGGGLYNIGTSNYSLQTGNATTAGYATQAGNASSAAYSTLTGTASTLATTGNISTTGYISAGSISGGNVYVPSGYDLYLSNTTSGDGTAVVPMICAAAIGAGDVVVYDPAGDNQVKRTTNSADQDVIGFALNTTSGAGQTVYVAVAGRVVGAKAVGSVTRGDYLETSAPLGSVRAVGSCFTNGATIGMALTSAPGGGSISVIVKKF